MSEGSRSRRGASPRAGRRTAVLDRVPPGSSRTNVAAYRRPRARRAVARLRRGPRFGRRSCAIAREQFQSIAEEHDTALEELQKRQRGACTPSTRSCNPPMKSWRPRRKKFIRSTRSCRPSIASSPGKVDELDHKNSDLRNLVRKHSGGDHIPWIRTSIIRNFTPAVAGIYNLIPSDQGRPLTDIMQAGLRYDTPEGGLRTVFLQTLAPLERRVVQPRRTTLTI